MPKIDRQAIYERDSGLCGFCGEPVPLTDFEADHVPPRALGLPHERLRVAHRLCNRRAGWEVRRQRHSPKSEEGYALRMPPDVKAELEEWAKQERRSLNSLLMVLLEQALRERRRKR